MRRYLIITTILLAACGGSSSDDTGDDTTGDDGGEPTTGAAVLAFSVTNGVRNSTGLVDPLVGTIYGQIFISSEVTLTGPIEGAVEYGNVEVAGVDLEAAMTAGAWTSPQLEPNNYTFLGFFDVDGNGASEHSPDMGDPVTLPISNQFDVTVGQDTQLTAVFDLVYN